MEDFTVKQRPSSDSVQGSLPVDNKPELSKLDQKIDEVVQDVFHQLQAPEPKPGTFQSLDKINFDQWMEKGVMVTNLLFHLNITNDDAAKEQFITKMLNKLESSDVDEITQLNIVNQLLENAPEGNVRERAQTYANELSQTERHSPLLKSSTISSTPPPKLAKKGSAIFNSFKNLFQKKGIEDVVKACETATPEEGKKLGKAKLKELDKHLSPEEKQGVPFLQEKLDQFESLSKDEQKALLKFISVLLFDKKNGTTHFNINNQMTHPKFGLKAQHKALQDAAGYIWIHTQEDELQAKLYYGFLGRATDQPEELQVAFPCSAKTEESKNRSIYKVPSNSYIKSIQNDDDSKMDSKGKAIDSKTEFHKSRIFQRDAKSLKIFVEGKAFNGVDQGVDQLHSEIQAFAGSPELGNTIETTLVQINNNHQNVLSKNNQLFVGNIDGRLQLFKDDQGNRYVTNATISRLHAGDIPTDDDRLLLYAQNVLIIDKEGNQSFYVISQEVPFSPDEEIQTVFNQCQAENRDLVKGWMNDSN